MISKSDSSLLQKAAAAAGQTTEQFARRVRGILRRAGCRDTSPRKRVFTAQVMQAIACV